MTIDQFFWVVARVAGLGSYAALAVALVTGIALRTAVLDWLGSNRALRSLHEYTTVLWIPLAAVHLAALLLDRTSRIALIDLVLPFHSAYGTLGIGLGTLAVDVLLVVTVTAYLKRRMSVELWKWPSSAAPTSAIRSFRRSRGRPAPCSSCSRSHVHSGAGCPPRGELAGDLLPQRDHMAPQHLLGLERGIHFLAFTVPPLHGEVDLRGL